MQTLRPLPGSAPGRLPWAMLLVLLCFVAITCHEGTRFHLAQTGQGSLNTDALPAALAFDTWTDYNLASHNMMRRQGLNAHDVARLRPYSVLLTVNSPGTEQDLTFLTGVHVTLSAPNHDPVTIAQGQNFLVGPNGAGLEVEDVDVTALARTGALTASLIMDAGQPPPVPVTLALTVVLDTEIAQPKGYCN